MSVYIKYLILVAFLLDFVRYRPDATSHTRLARSTLASVHALACTRVCFTREFAHTRVCRTREFTHTRVCCAREFTRIYSRLALRTESVYTLSYLLRRSLSASLPVAKCIYAHSTI